MKILIGIVWLVLTLPLACKNADSEEASVTMEASADAGSESKAMTLSMPGQKTTIEDQSQKIIREAHLRYKSDDIKLTYNQIITAAKKYQATVQNDAEGKDHESVFRNITLRIPSAKFDSFISDISKGVEYFDRKEISAQDVTREFIDLEARLKAKKTLEARYLELLKKASKISELLEIEKQLSAIREEIEAQEGQLRYMQHRVSLSTVNIEVYKPVAFGGGVTVSYGTKMWNAIKQDSMVFPLSL